MDATDTKNLSRDFFPQKLNVITAEAYFEDFDQNSIVGIEFKLLS